MKGVANFTLKPSAWTTAASWVSGFGEGKNFVKSPTAWAMLRDTHAEFHEAAAHVLSLALAGHTREAIRAMEPGSQYDQWSVTMTDALHRYAAAAGVGS